MKGAITCHHLGYWVLIKRLNTRLHIQRIRLIDITQHIHLLCGTMIKLFKPHKFFKLKIINLLTAHFL